MEVRRKDLSFIRTQANIASGSDYDETGIQKARASAQTPAQVVQGTNSVEAF
jgi:hypothetical protein